MRELLSSEKATPLDVLMEIATDPENPAQIRGQCAAWAAPYVFPRLSMAVVGTANITAKDDASAIVSRVLDRIQRIAETAPTIEHQPADAAA